MNLWMIGAIIAGLLIIGIFAASSFTTAQNFGKTSTGCRSCDGKCTSENNCGESTCSAANTGICNCGKS